MQSASLHETAHTQCVGREPEQGVGPRSGQVHAVFVQTALAQTVFSQTVFGWTVFRQSVFRWTVLRRTAFVQTVDLQMVALLKGPTIGALIISGSTVVRVTTVVSRRRKRWQGREGQGVEPAGDGVGAELAAVRGEGGSGERDGQWITGPDECLQQRRGGGVVPLAAQHDGREPPFLGRTGRRAPHVGSRAVAERGRA
ncbi:hypothetical protein FHS29_001492 [Saccharothrix tamanrassetensis]|uniref:Uncharacterized protein n=1 Tax=Saccharothrix tamanrassetensis TaxID=1051531 RepID=A0A841C8Q4_9PSEU|nr:hypothetical protein [Saccharothrix tamanrassetensis]MBB5954922.1 hypothetical protein [Saccharothrix tamanrassetensis]